MKILAIGAHPDDIEIFMFGILFLLKERGDEIWYIDLLDELCDWGSPNTDRAIAFGMCLIHENDNFAIEVKDREKESIKESGFIYYKYDSNGIPVKHIR